MLCYVTIVLFVGDNVELKKARYILSTIPTIKMFALEKHRRHCSMGGCSIELTHIRLEGTEREYWSVCIEGRQSAVEKLLKQQMQYQGNNKTVEQVLLNLSKGAAVQGYPEMVTKL